MRDDKLLSRISALLRKAENTDNEHEAEAFMQAAQRLATASSIDLAVARDHDPDAKKRTTPISRQIHIGEKGKRGLKTYVQLFVSIARPNDVTVDVAGNSTFVLAYGFESDIDTTEALYSSLVVQMVAASDGYLRSGAYRGETFARVVTRGSGWRARRVVEEKALSPITARLNFQSAFAERIGKRLRQAREEATEQALAAERSSGSGSASGSGRGTGGRGAGAAEVSAGSTSTEIAMRHKEIEVADFYKVESKARGTWRPSSASAGYSEAARRAGDRAGRRAKIGPDRQFGGARGSLEG